MNRQLYNDKAFRIYEQEAERSTGWLERLFYRPVLSLTIRLNDGTVINPAHEEKIRERLRREVPGFWYYSPVEHVWPLTVRILPKGRKGEVALKKIVEILHNSIGGYRRPEFQSD